MHHGNVSVPGRLMGYLTATGTPKSFIGAGRNLQVNVLKHSEENMRTCQFGFKYRHFCNMTFCRIATFGILFFSLNRLPDARWQQSKWCSDGGSVFLSVRCWFVSVKWKDRFGRQPRCGSYHNNLSPPPSPPFSFLLIQLTAVCYNGHTPCLAEWHETPSHNPTNTVIAFPSSPPPIQTSCWGDRS